MALTARLTPHWFHEFVISRIFSRTADDTFPTVYKANTRRAIRHHAREGGLEPVRLEFLEGRPEYVRFSAPTYLAGWMYERTVNRFSALQQLRIVIIATLRKGALSAEKT
jgi:hypothetical protein